VTKLSRVASMKNVMLMERLVTIAIKDGLRFITMRERQMARKRSDVPLAQTPTCSEMVVKNVQLKMAA